MNLITYPLDNVEYTADDAALFHATRTTGIHAGDDFTFYVNGADNTVTLGPGIAWMNISRFKGLVSALKIETGVDMGLPDPIYPRIDHVVLQYSANNNAVSTVVKSGVAASSPQPPTRSMTEALYEIHLLRVRREPGAIAISASDVTDLRLDSEWCGLMAESVTNIDTDSINRNVQNILEEVKRDTKETLDATKEEADIILNSIEDELANLEAGTAVELKKLLFSNVDVAVSAFTSFTDTELNTAGYGYRAAVPLEGVLASMIPQVTFSAKDSTSGIFAPVADSYNGGVYLYTNAVPDGAITVPTIILWRGGA